MDPHLMRIYQYQVLTQCKFALQAYEDLTAQMAVLTVAPVPDRRFEQPTGMSHEQMRIQAMEIALESGTRSWYPVQALLTAVANISKALWGQGGRKAPEREALRTSLGVSDSSSLRETAMRNNFDHFDERLDDWWGTSESHNYVDLNFGDVGHLISGIPEDEMFRSFDPQSGDVVFWGQKYNLPTIITEVERIAEAAIIGAARA